MQEADFREYIRRFNEEDDTAFDDYLAENMHMRNGTLEYTGIDGMKHHYRVNIWPHFVERLEVPAYVSDGKRIGIKMLMHFTARRDNDDTIFGPVKAGETFDFDGIIMYELDAEGKFADIQVAYNAFVFTNVAGERRDLGIPH